MTPTVGDLFCGAGGFSEGFRQAGFKIIWAIDNWKDAKITYENNHSGTKVLADDISEIDFQQLPKVDILIGGPPCTFFSLANKAGNGQAEEGLKLVQKFVEAVEIIKPKFWIMENVPRLAALLEAKPKSGDNASGRRLRRILKYLPTRIVLNAADFAIPQKRRRLFSGSFPIPDTIDSDPKEWIPMRKVVDALPYPLLPSENQGEIADPLYADVRIAEARLTDHFMDTRLDEDDIESSRRGKLRHYWGGEMSFPDSLDKPSRSVLAKISKSSRQTVVIQDFRGPDPVYRIPTVRESASLQGFPITYQFWGESPHSRYVLVGNAVPPPMGKAIALRIRSEMGLTLTPKIPIQYPARPAPPPTLFGKPPKYRFPIHRLYRQFIPGTIRHSCRVDFDNRGRRPESHPTGLGKHIVKWETTLALGYSRDYASFAVDFPIAARIALLVAQNGGIVATQLLKNMVARAAELFSRMTPDASTLQATWARRMNSPQGPDWVVDQVRQICLSELENARLRGDEFKLFAKTFLPMLRDVRVSHGKDSRKAKWTKKCVTFYAACCLVTTSIAAVFANQGSVWLKQNWNQAYKGEPLRISGDYPVSLGGLGVNQIVAAFLQLQGSDSENQDANDREIDKTREEKVLRHVELNP